MRYIFDWEDIVHGQIEIEANSGVEAEKLFRDMALTQRLQTSIVGSDKHTLDIKFVDMGIDDIVTNKEWQDDWKHIV